MKGDQAVRSIANRAASCRKFALLINPRNGMARHQHHQLVALAVEERIGAGDERACVQFGKEMMERNWAA
jgi:hypothetical protein